MKKGDLDIRFFSERLGHTETVCDECGEVILSSENRFEVSGLALVCEHCRDKRILKIKGA